MGVSRHYLLLKLLTAYVNNYTMVEMLGLVQTHDADLAILVLQTNDVACSQ